jgi:hypothetical protein
MAVHGHWGLPTNVHTSLTSLFLYLKKHIIRDRGITEVSGTDGMGCRFAHNLCQYKKNESKTKNTELVQSYSRRNSRFYRVKFFHCIKCKVYDRKFFSLPDESDKKKECTLECIGLKRQKIDRIFRASSN